MIRPGDYLRLEIEVPPAVGVRSLIANGSGGEYQTSGWIAPVPGTTLTAPTTVEGAAAYGFEGVAPGGVAVWYCTELIAMTPGDFAAAYWTSPWASSGWQRGRLQFLAADAVTILGQSAASDWAVAGQGPGGAVPATQAPAGTAWVRLRLDHAGASDTSSPPAAGDVLNWRDAILTTAPTAAGINLAQVIDGPTWLDVLGPTHAIKIDRAPLDVGTLNATILDATIDPAVGATIRPGREIRVRALTPTGWVTIYRGRLVNAEVTYDLRRRASDPRGARIALVAADAVRKLAANSRPLGHGTTDGLRATLQGTGVPWRVHGSNRLGPSVPATVAVNDAATALDQVVITRDSRRGRAHVDRCGVLNITDPSNAWYNSDVVVATLNEATYSALDVAYSTAGCINEVLIKHQGLSPDDGSTVETVHGPYRLESSIRDWGPYRAEIVAQGLTAAEIAALGADVLTRNGVPAARVNSVRIPIRHATDVARAQLDLYDRVQVINAAKSINQTLRIASITHEITPSRWLVDIGFTGVTSVAAPLATPPLTSSPSVQEGVWQAPALAAGWANYANGFQTARYRRVAGLVYLSGLVRSGGGDIFTLPIGYRPAARLIFPVTDGTQTAGRMDVFPDGRVHFAAGNNGFVSLDGILFEAAS